jgi:hypothetical protein
MRVLRYTSVHRDTTYTAKNIYSKPTTPPNRFIFSAPLSSLRPPPPSTTAPIFHDDLETRCLRRGVPLMPPLESVTRFSLLFPDLSQARRGERASSNHDASRRGQNLLSYAGPRFVHAAGGSTEAEMPGEHLHLTLWPCECYSNDNSHVQ